MGTLPLVGSPSCFVIVALREGVETSTNFGDTFMNVRSVRFEKHHTLTLGGTIKANSDLNQTSYVLHNQGWRGRLLNQDFNQI